MSIMSPLLIRFDSTTVIFKFSLDVARSGTACIVTDSAGAPFTVIVFGSGCAKVKDVHCK